MKEHQATIESQHMSFERVVRDAQESIKAFDRERLLTEAKLNTLQVNLLEKVHGVAISNAKIESKVDAIIETLRGKQQIGMSEWQRCSGLAF